MSNNSQDWQKLSPYALVYFIVHFFFRFIKDGLLNILPPFAVLLLQVENKLLWFSIGAAAFIASVVVYAVLFFIFFRYKLTPDEVLLQRGVLKKQQLNLNFARIQNVNLSTPLYFSPFNIVNAQLDAAGSKGQEVVLAGIDKHRAELLRQEVFSYAKDNPEELEAESIDGNDIQGSVFNLLNKEVVKFGLFSSTVFLALALLAPFQKQLTPLLTQNLVQPLSKAFSHFITSESLVFAFAVTAVLIGIVTTMLLLSCLAAFVRFYNFELIIDSEKIKRTCGLLERAQFSLQKSKIQSIEVKQNWMAKLLNRYTLSVKQINNSSPGKAQKQQSLIVPVLTQEQVNSVLDMCWDEPVKLHDIDYQGISSRFLVKTIGLYVFTPAVIASIALFTHLSPIILAAIGAYLVLGTGLSYLRYKRHGFAFFDNQVAVRKGLFGTSYKLFKAYKAQQVTQIQTPMMAKNGLASLRFTLASGNITLPYLPQPIVQEQLNYSVYLAESSAKSWM